MRKLILSLVFFIALSGACFADNFIFPWGKTALTENTDWIGYNKNGGMLFESRFYARISRYPNTTDIFSPSQDGAWNMDEDGFGGYTCTGITNTGTTEQLTDPHSLSPAIFSEGGLDFDNSSLPDDTVVTSITLGIYRNSFSKS